MQAPNTATAMPSRATATDSIPVSSVKQEEAERLLKMEEYLHQRIIGQHEAVTALARATRRSRAGLKNPLRPVGSFIFLGPTGVGKTEVGKGLAESLCVVWLQ